jgi:hypothetical protein
MNAAALIDDEEGEGDDEILNFGFSSRSLRSSNNNSSNRTDISSPVNSNNGVLPLKFQLHPSVAYTFQSIDSGHMKLCLSSLQDEHSTYMKVAKACHFLNQFGTHGSYNATPTPSSSTAYATTGAGNDDSSIKTPTVVHSSTIQIQEYTSDMTHILNALSNAATSHSDRRCRILTLQSLSIIANATLYKIIPTPKLYCNREDMLCISRIHDEICNDVIITIVNCALDDEDDGVSSIAIECLGRFISNDATNHNELSKEIYNLQHKMMTKSNHLIPRMGIWDGEGGKGGYGASYASKVQDIDYHVQKSDIVWRIMESVLAPRIRKLFVRVCLLKDMEHQMRCLTVMNDIMIFVYKTERARRGVKSGKDRFAKRWYDFDATMLIQEYVQIFLIPLLRNLESFHGSTIRYGIETSIGVVMNALMLCSVVKCKEAWLDQLLQLSVHNLEFAVVQLSMQNDNLEMKTNTIAATLIALRGIQRIERVKTLIALVDIITGIPSTNAVPRGPISVALQFEDGSRRIPSRTGFWAEIALTILLPDGLSTNDDINKMSMMTKRKFPQYDTGSSWIVLKYFLESPCIQTLFNSRAKYKINSVINPAEELVYTFCSVAYTIGKRIFPHIVSLENGSTVEDDRSHVIINVNTSRSEENGEGSSWIQSEFESWFHASLELLNSFLPCITWNEPDVLSSETNTTNNFKESENATTLCHASQQSYIELLKVVLFASSALSTTSSVFLHFACSIPTIPDENSSETLRSSSQSNIITENELKLLLDRLLKVLTESEKEMSRKQRICLLAMLSDTWVQRCKVMISLNGGLQLDQKEIAGPVDVDEDVANINEQQARQLLSQLAMEISTILAEEKKRKSNPNDGSVKEGSQRYLMTCIASVESIGYTAQLLVNHFTESKTNIENEESAKHIVSICTVVLKGQGKAETEVDSDERSASSGLDSPPPSPRSKPRITAYTSECADAAKRLQNFVGFYDQEFEFGEKNDQSIDFNYLCPLLKRPNFCVVEDNHYFTNDLWTMENRFSLIHVGDDSNSPLFGHLATPVTKDSLFHTHHHFSGETYHLGYFLQLYRQLLSQQVENAIESSPLHFLKHPLSVVECSSFPSFSSYRNLDPLRLSTPPLPAERFPSSCMLNKGIEKWSNSTHTISSGSDPLAITLSYSLRQLSRFDGDVEWGFAVTITVHNITAVPILNGVRLDATISQQGSYELSSEDISSIENREFRPPNLIMTETSVYKKELKAGGHFFWEFVLDSWPLGGEICVNCTLRELEAESSTYQLLEFPNDDEQKDANNDDNKNKNEALDKVGGDHEEGEETVDVVFAGAPISVSPMIILQPNPLVFYRDCLGDQTAYQFLWFSMPHHLTEIKIILSAPDFKEENQTSTYFHNINGGALSSSSITNISFHDNTNIDKDRRTLSAWAFSTWCGKHLFAMIIPEADEEKSSQCSLLVRGDDMNLLQCCVEAQKSLFVSDLTCGKWSVV